MTREEYQARVEAMAESFTEQVKELSLKIRDLETENERLKREVEFYKRQAKND